MRSYPGFGDLSEPGSLGARSVALAKCGLGVHVVLALGVEAKVWRRQYPTSW